MVNPVMIRRKRAELTLKEKILCTITLFFFAALFFGIIFGGIDFIETRFDRPDHYQYDIVVTDEDNQVYEFNNVGWHDFDFSNRQNVITINYNGTKRLIKYKNVEYKKSVMVEVSEIQDVSGN